MQIDVAPFHFAVRLVAGPRFILFREARWRNAQV